MITELVSWIILGWGLIFAFLAFIDDRRLNMFLGYISAFVGTGLALFTPLIKGLFLPYIAFIQDLFLFMGSGALFFLASYLAYKRIESIR